MKDTLKRFIMAARFVVNGALEVAELALDMLDEDGIPRQHFVGTHEQHQVPLQDMGREDPSDLVQVNGTEGLPICTVCYTPFDPTFIVEPPEGPQAADGKCSACNRAGDTAAGIEAKRLLRREQEGQVAGGDRAVMQNALNEAGIEPQAAAKDKN